MKYFTPELLARFRSADEDVSAAALDEWERAIVRSNRRWTKIAAAFPKEVRQFDENVCLHDARVLSIGRQGDAFVMVLQPEPPAQTVAVLTFTLEADPIIDTTAVREHPHPSYAEWMYEEFDVDRRGRLWFEVLLSNGWSVKLCFRDFRYLIADRLFPVPAEPAAVPPAAPAIPQSA
jgi:hypothetical protein